MSDKTVGYRDLEAPKECPQCIAWHAEYQRAAHLLGLLAEDHFPDQESFDRWMNTQMVIALRDLRAIQRAERASTDKDTSQ